MLLVLQSWPAVDNTGPVSQLWRAISTTKGPLWLSWRQVQLWARADRRMATTDLPDTANEGPLRRHVRQLRAVTWTSTFGVPCHITARGCAVARNVGAGVYRPR